MASCGILGMCFDRDRRGNTQADRAAEPNEQRNVANSANQSNVFDARGTYECPYHPGRAVRHFVYPGAFPGKAQQVGGSAVFLLGGNHRSDGVPDECLCDWWLDRAVSCRCI